MLRQTLLYVLATTPFIGLALTNATRADTPQKISGPHTYENLSIYFIHGKSADGPVPLTLDEALAKGFVEVHETDTVSQLIIENKGRDEVFVHAGDIVKGGKQDRVVTASFVLAAKSKPTEVPVYCVEAGRWAPRGREDSRKFSASAEMLPTKEAKFAMMAAPTTTAALARTEEPRARGDRPLPQRADVDTRNVDRFQRQAEEQSREALAASLNARPASGQGEVWRNVEVIQEKLSAKLKKSVASQESASSLQLALEDKDLAEHRERFVKALQPVGEAEGDVVGYAIAINGKIASADVYASNALFKKLWPRLLKTAVTEAISAEEVKDAKAPVTAEVAAFLAQPADVKAEQVQAVVGTSVRARADATSYDAETYRGDTFLHRSKLAR